LKYLLKKDLITGVLFLALGIFAVLVAIPMGVQVPSSVSVRALSPDFWPLVICGGVILSALFLIVEAWVMPRQADDAEDIANNREFQYPALPATIRTLTLIAAWFAFYLSLTTLGVVVASIILIIAMMLLFDERRIWLIGVLGVATPVLLYLFFRYVASVAIPLGLFEA